MFGVQVHFAAAKASKRELVSSVTEMKEWLRQAKQEAAASAAREARLISKVTSKSIDNDIMEVGPT